MKNINIQNTIVVVISIFLFGFVGMQDDVWKAPQAAKKIVNPTTSSSTSISKGKKIFRSRCAVCHGPQGIGNGPGGKALLPKPANLTSSLVQNQTDGEMFWKITNGRNDMIKWGPILSEQQRWDLVNYVKSLK